MLSYDPFSKAFSFKNSPIFSKDKLLIWEKFSFSTKLKTSQRPSEAKTKIL